MKGEKEMLGLQLYHHKTCKCCPVSLLIRSQWLFSKWICLCLRICLLIVCVKISMDLQISTWGKNIEKDWLEIWEKVIEAFTTEMSPARHMNSSQGNILPFLQLSRRITAQPFNIHFYNSNLSLFGLITFLIFLSSSSNCVCIGLQCFKCIPLTWLV